MKGSTLNLGNLIIFGVLLFITWAIMTALFPELAAVNIIPAFLISAGVLALGRGLLNFKSLFPIPIKWHYAVVILVIGLFMAGIPILEPITATLGGFGMAPATVSPPPAGGGVPLSECKASVATDIQGTAAIITVNAYDLEANAPYTSAIDETVDVFYGSSITEANKDTLVTTLTDTTAGSLTNVVAGDVISFFDNGNSTAVYYVDPKTGVCIGSQRETVNLDAHQIMGATSGQVVVYDDTGATELSSDTCADYYMAVSANEKPLIHAKFKVNTANRAMWLAGIGLLTGKNITNIYPTGESAALFTKVSTPEWLQDVSVNFNATDDQVTATKTYTVYKLNQPVMLGEYDSRTYKLKIEASANDPVDQDCLIGSASGENWAGVGILFIDQMYIRGEDGKMYLDIHDHTSTEGNVGLNEAPTSPIGKYTGALITTT